MTSDEVTISLKQYIMREVRQRIIDGRYTLGQRLSENTLAQELETSRAPVRDALMTLRAEGLVQVYPQRGSYVFNPDVEERRAMCEICAVYECGALYLAMENNKESLCAALAAQREQEDMASHATEPAVWCAIDRKFHAIIVQMSGNSLLIGAYEVMSTRLAALAYRMPYSAAYHEGCLAAQKKMLSLISLGDKEHATALLRNNNRVMADSLCM